MIILSDFLIRICIRRSNTLLNMKVLNLIPNRFFSSETLKLSNEKKEKKEKSRVVIVFYCLIF